MMSIKYTDSILNIITTRVYFNPANKKHRLAFKHFLEHNKWSGLCNFYLEYPFTDIPSMIRYKLAKYIVSKEKPSEDSFLLRQ